MNVQRLHDLLTYDSSEGAVRWRARKGRARAGDLAGCVGARGYNRICVDGVSLRRNRVVWALCHNYWPHTDLDHIDRDKLNDRISNLRLATRAQNKQNVVHRGVRRRGQTWTAQIKIAGRSHHLGVFATEEAAHGAYLAAKKEHHPFWTE